MDPRSELGDAIRAWRDRASASASGVPIGSARRVPGLRREELASLAGLSVDYIIRLEQGRSVNPSPQVVAALGRALRLTIDERDTLYRLAGISAPTSGVVSTHIPPGVHRMTDRLADFPVAVFGPSWNIIQWNAPWAALLGDPSEWRDDARNLIWRSFLGAETRVQYAPSDEAAFKHSLVSDLRAALARYLDDPDITELLDTMLQGSEEFAQIWNLFEVWTRQSSRKTVIHPLVGAITLDCDVMTVTGDDLRIVVYTAEPGSVDAANLELVAIAGLQQLVD
jgi:transcriptional regulator with XRE-family HTH domain